MYRSPFASRCQSASPNQYNNGSPRSSSELMRNSPFHMTGGAKPKNVGCEFNVFDTKNGKLKRCRTSKTNENDTANCFRSTETQRCHVSPEPRKCEYQEVGNRRNCRITTDKSDNTELCHKTEAGRCVLNSPLRKRSPKKSPGREAEECDKFQKFWKKNGVPNEGVPTRQPAHKSPRHSPESIYDMEKFQRIREVYSPKKTTHNRFQDPNMKRQSASTGGYVFY
jgi:hypothetical protein